jgi:hypothetical protein
MKQNEMTDIHKIIMRTLKVVPKAWDMNHQHFNSDCHMELTDRTYYLVGERFDTTPEEGKKIVDHYFQITGGQV